MSKRPMTRDETTGLLLSAYFGLDKQSAAEVYDTDAGKKKLDKFIERMNVGLYESPGAHMASSLNTLWGVINAVTYDQDHNRPALNQGNRLNAAWFGEGEQVKRRAWEQAKQLMVA